LLAARDEKIRDNTNVIAECIGAVSLASWITLLVGRGGFWRMKLSDSPVGSPRNRRVAVIVPARNEAELIGRTVGPLLRQDYEGEFQVFLVDDHSEDGTEKEAWQAAEREKRGDRLTIVRARELPRGWTGKLWAVSEGLIAAENFDAEYFWLTDADIEHDPGVLRGLAQQAESGGFDLVSRMVKLHCESIAERLLIPAFVFFFFKLYPPAWVNRTGRKIAAAAGGCILVRREALERIGGVRSIRDELIDDCALARAVKPAGKIWLEVTAESRSLRGYGSFREIRNMVARTAFTQLRHSWLLLGGVIGGMGLVYVAPVILPWFGGWAAVLGTSAWMLMTISYQPVLRRYGLPWWWAILLPVSAVFYSGATIDSAFRYGAGQGGSWKGRVQDVGGTSP
jgi:hopene-associated glycosyltransferase HpnB